MTFIPYCCCGCLSLLLTALITGSILLLVVIIIPEVTRKKLEDEQVQERMGLKKKKTFLDWLSEIVMAIIFLTLIIMITVYIFSNLSTSVDITSVNETIASLR